jgi:PAS domain S-box-containing protein
MPIAPKVFFGLSAPFALALRAIKRPVAALVDDSKRIEESDTSVRGEERNDELGGLARAFNQVVLARRAAEKSLRRANAQLESLFRASPVAIAGIDARGNYDVWNPAAERLFGWTADEMTTHAQSAVPEGEWAHHEEVRKRVLEHSEVVDFEKKRRRKDGTLFDARIVVAPRLEDDRVVGLMAVVEDISERKRAAEARDRSENALRESEARYRALVEQAPDGIFIADVQGRYTDVNPAGCRMLGYTRDELLGKTKADLLAPEDVPRLSANRELLRTSGNSVVTEWMLRRKDGGFLPVEVNAKILSDGRWQSFVRDISERKRGETALRQSEAALKRAQAIAHVGSWELDLRTNHVTRSAEVYAIYGIEDVDAWAARESLDQFVHPDDRERVGPAVAEARRNGSPISLEHRIIRPNGEERFVRVLGDCAYEDGVPVGSVGVIVDITDIKRAEREREESLRWLRQVLDESPVGLFLVRGERRVETNRAGLAMMGRSVDRIPEPGDFLFTSSGNPVARDDFPSRRALRGERIDWAEYTLRGAQGRMIPLLVGSAPVLDDKGQPEGAVVVFQDITPLKELERLRAEWSSVVAHDLRQPLNTIGLYAQLLALRAPREHAVHAEQIRSASALLDRIVSDLMDLSRIDARQFTLSRTAVDLAALVRGSVDRVALGAPDRRLELQISEGVPCVDADAHRLNQVMDNLLTNAIKYGLTGTPVVVGVTLNGDCVAVAVTNEGIGIAPEDLPNLFRRFHRTDYARVSGVEGIGLGLYISRELIEAHGGRITVESTQGATTTFTFTLPVPPI